MQPHFPPLQPTLPISSLIPAGLLFFFTHRSQPPLHTPDKLPSVSRSSAHRAAPTIARTTDRPSPVISLPQHRQPPPPSPQQLQRLRATTDLFSISAGQTRQKPSSRRPSWSSSRPPETEKEKQKGKEPICRGADPKRRKRERRRSENKGKKN